MVVTRSGEAGSLVVATCALFDTRVFIWRLRDSWVAAGQAAAAAAPPCGASSSSSSETAEAEAARLAAARAACWDPAATQAYGAAAIAASPGAAAPIAAAAAVSGSDDDAAASGPGPGSAAAGGGQYELRHAFTTPDQEPVVDISISTTAHRLFIIGMESVSWRRRGRCHGGRCQMQRDLGGWLPCASSHTLSGPQRLQPTLPLGEGLPYSCCLP